jgi:hypothetical protein
MQVSLQSKVCLATCAAISAYAAYSNPARWVTWYVVSALAETIFCRSDFLAAKEGHKTEFRCMWGEDKEIRQKAIKSLANSMPGLVTTAINLLALGVISQIVQLPSGWNPGIEAAIYNQPAITSGAISAALFYLYRLQKEQDPRIQNLLEQAII